MMIRKTLIIYDINIIILITYYIITCQLIMTLVIKESKFPQCFGLGKQKITSKHFKFQNSTKNKINIAHSILKI